MRNSILPSFTAVALGASLLIDSKTLAGTEDLRKLELKLELVRSRAVLYEPVVLRFTVRNPTSHTIRSEVRTRGTETELYIKVQYENEAPLDYGSGPIGTFVKRASTVHDAGQVMEDDQLIFFNGWKRDVAFRRVGRYRIMARMGVGGDKEVGTVIVDALPVSLEVVEPSESDRSMIADLGSESDLIRALNLGPEEICKGGGGEECYNRLGRLVYRHRESAYAPFLALKLARGIQPKGKLDINGRLVSTIDLLEDIQRMWPGHPIQSRVAEALVFATVRQEDLEGARRLLTEFETNHPNRREAIRAMQLEIQGVPSLGDGEPDEQAGSP